MKVLVAPDSFGGTLTAPQAARAIADGWWAHAPADEVTTVPMADGGPGFVDVLHTAAGGELVAGTVAGPAGRPVPVTWLADGDTAWIETAQACGLHLLDPLDPWHATSAGVGEAIDRAVEAGARTVVLGLGGSGTNDGGAGLLAALGARADVPLDAGPEALSGVSVVDVTAVRERLAGVRLIAATDVGAPLLGMFGASKTFGPQKGLAEDEILRVDRILDGFVTAVCGSTPSQRAVADRPGAGAAGGIGFALLLLGAETVSGAQVVAETVGLPDACARHDLVVSGEGTFDHSSRIGKVVHRVAALAQEAVRPCIVLAGQVSVGAREQRALGVESAYAMADHVGVRQAMAEPYESLVALATRVAGTWSR